MSEKGFSAAHNNVMSLSRICDVCMAGCHDKQGCSFDNWPLDKRMEHGKGIVSAPSSLSSDSALCRAD